ncbi:hypothetical protein PUN28_016665 [Cardiocondyla obscurior]|uniref:Uncharacterized protein n=1 Tax=Cardiocondyla obscurior TaxID=286306 RepID=A0AAW2EQI6_9HYME
MLAGVVPVAWDGYFRSNGVRSPSIVVTFCSTVFQYFSFVYVAYGLRDVDQVPSRDPAYRAEQRNTLKRYNISLKPAVR